MADVNVDLENTNGKDLLDQGMRAFVLQDFQTAVQALGKASEVLVAEKGDELDESLGEVYLYYGKSLLGLSRQEAGPLGDAIPKGENEESEDEEEVEGENEEADNDANESRDSEENKGENGEEKGENGVEKEENGVENGEKGASTSENGKNEHEDSAISQDGDPTDLQVAWEVLELAKKIFEKKGSEGKKQLAETLTTLGEISLETEHFEEAIVDIKDGLAIQIELYPKDSRKVAETYYNLGIAYSTNTQFDLGIDAFNKSLEYLENRIKVLEEKGDGEEEIKEIKELIPELMEKIADMKSCKEETLKSLAEFSKHVREKSDNSDGAGSSTAKPATDISHLVKRKRKSEENADENPPKKVSQ